MESSDQPLARRALALSYVLWFAFTGLAISVLILATPALIAFSDVHAFYPEAEIVAPQILITVTGIVGIMLILLAVLVSMGMSALLFWRGDRSFMVIFTSLFLMGFSVIIAGPLEFAERHNPELFPPSFSSIMWLIYFTIGATWLFWIFPNGRYVPAWSRHLVLPMALLSVVSSIMTGGGNQRDSTLELVLTLTASGLVMFSIASQIYRYIRISSVTERQQTRWVLVGLFILLVLLGISSIGYTTDPSVPVTAWRLIGGTLWSLGMAVIPVSLTVAILRYRLWAVDLIIRRTLTYALITLVMAGTYYGGVVLLQTAFVRITGQQSPLAVVASTLAIAALFNPLRTRIQNFIDRRFDRRKYDAQRTLDEFAASVRDEVDMVNLEKSLMSVVNETMQPNSVSLWMREGKDSSSS